jgi:hypothetical protein
MKIHTFIFVHDQNIILDFLKYEKFKDIPKLTYIFLGNRDIDKIEDLENVIIARNLEHNIEQYPKLTSYTGWYCIWKNNLTDSDYINLFEYDVNLHNDLISELENIITKDKVDVIGYIPFNVHHYNFLGHKPWCEKLIYSLQSIYNVDVIENIKKFPATTECSMTSNHTMSINVFKRYMDWIDKMILNIRESTLSGHEVERSISLFYLLNKISYKILPNYLTHFQFDSHQTQGISQNKFSQKYNELLQ